MSLDKKEKPKMYKCLHQDSDGKWRLYGEITVLSDAEQDEARMSALREIRIESLEVALFGLAIYIGLTLWLNAVQFIWPIWIVWILIVAQIFSCYELGGTFYSRFYNDKVGFFGKEKYYYVVAILTMIFGIVARVIRLELIIIPAIVALFLIISAIHNTNKNIKYGG